MLNEKNAHLLRAAQEYVVNDASSSFDSRPGSVLDSVALLAYFCCMCRQNPRIPSGKRKLPLLCCCLAVLFCLSAAALSADAGLLEKFINKLENSANYDDLPRIRSSRDANNNGISDTDDLILGGRAEAERRPTYRSAYYRGGYPPDDEGVCTDVIWRAYRDAGYDIKALIDADIRANTAAYPRVGGKPDPNIDFRRVPNLRVFFQRHGATLTTEIIPHDRANLALWQPGDIVTFTNPDHIAILSDKRNAEGIPLLLHNDGPWASEGDDFMLWYQLGITGHYRYPKD